MDPQRDDYEEYDYPALPIDSPAALLRLLAKTTGVAALCTVVLLALHLTAAGLLGLLLD
jgi:hypothetical protein